jgi:hypothetical protein
MDGRKSAYWMKQLDERILEFIDREGWASPSLMAHESAFEASAGHIKERCEKLQFVGFVAPIAGNMYDLTTDGQLYLEGEIDADNRRWPPGERVLKR